jgi:hypothetical protein
MEACCIRSPKRPLIIGSAVTAGHHVVLHGCTIGDGSLIGIRATILNNARIGRNCMVAAGALVTEGKEFPDGSLILGAPAKAVAKVTHAQLALMRFSSEHYVKNAQRFKLTASVVESEPMRSDKLLFRNRKICARRQVNAAATGRRARQAPRQPCRTRAAVRPRVASRTQAGCFRSLEPWSLPIAMTGSVRRHSMAIMLASGAGKSSWPSAPRCPQRRIR